MRASRLVILASLVGAVIAAAVTVAGCVRRGAVDTSRPLGKTGPASREPPGCPELEGKRFLFSVAAGLGHEPGITRRDPSDIIAVDGLWYVWYTRVDQGRLPVRLRRLKHSGYVGTIWWATSRDAGHHWVERGEALGPGAAEAFDSFAVFTPNIVRFAGRYYLYYTGVRPSPGSPGEFRNDASHDPTAIGVAVADDPAGPFRRLRDAPVLRPSRPDREGRGSAAFDSYRVDDAALVLRDHDRDGDLDLWLYYKGRNIDDGAAGPGRTRMGLAIADRPEAPHRRMNDGRAVLPQSHEVLVWSHREGVAAYASISQTIEYAADGIDFVTHRLAASTGPRPIAPGACREDLVRGEAYGRGISWGLAMRDPSGPEPYLVRFEIDLRVGPR